MSRVPPPVGHVQIVRIGGVGPAEDQRQPGAGQGVAVRVELSVLDHQVGVVDGRIADELLVAADHFDAGKRIRCPTIDSRREARGRSAWPAPAGMSRRRCRTECSPLVPAYGSATFGTPEICVLPQPLSVPCASPKVAFRLWPLQVALVLDITSHPLHIGERRPVAGDAGGAAGREGEKAKRSPRPSGWRRRSPSTLVVGLLLTVDVPW